MERADPRHEGAHVDLDELGGAGERRVIAIFKHGRNFERVEVVSAP